ncbi:MAG: TetR/AcrR family transcriptional regulator [Gaiellaceae bacterium]
MLSTALRLADERGIESLTMRKLAGELGVEAMSLYHYVAKKEELLEGIVGLVLQEIDAPAPGSDWKPALRQLAISAHEALVRHPWACNFMLSTGRPERLQYMESLLGTLRNAGFSADLTHHAYHALDSHTVGFTLWAVSLQVPDGDLADLAATFLRKLPAEYPFVAEHVEQHLTATGDESEFGFGLDLILDGLERMRDAAS